MTYSYKWLLFWLLVFIALKAIGYWIRAFRLYVLAKKYKLDYKIGDLLLITLKKEPRYERNTIKGDINGHKIEFFDWYKYKVTPWLKRGSILRVDNEFVSNKVGKKLIKDQPRWLWISELKKEFARLENF